MADQEGAYVTGPRDTYGPPHREAANALRDKPVGATVIVTRKGRGILRWDASLWEVRDIHGTLYPWMVKVRFGLTRRGALWALRRAAESAPYQPGDDR